MAVSTYRIWERKDIGIQLKKEKRAVFAAQIKEFSKNIKKFSLRQPPLKALLSFEGDDFVTRARRWDV
jgi:hypothetical protein